MKLVIHAHALKNESLSQSITAQFDERGGTIGRSDTNTLTLPDPERHVSRLQAEVLFAGRAFSIRNVGSANPIELNGRNLRPGEGAPLVPGDQLVIGGYAMRVTADVSAAGAAATPRVDSRTVIRASAGEARTDPPRAVPTSPEGASQGARAPAAAARDADPFADLMGGAGTPAASDPFADLMAPPAAMPPAPAPRAALPPARAGSARSSRTPAPPAAAAPTLLPDDFDPFADITSPARGVESDLADFMDRPVPGAARAPSGAPAAPVSSLDDLLGLGQGPGAGASSGASLDSMFGLTGKGADKSGGDLLGDFLAPAKPAGVKPSDVLDLFGDGGERAASPTAPAAFNHTPELAGAYSPPVVKPPPAARRAAPPPTSAPVPAAAPTPAPTPAPTFLPPARAPAAGRREDDFARTQFPATAPAALPRALAAQGPPPPAVAPREGSSPEALWRAFCEGSGIALQLPQGLNPQMMRMLGQLMHHSIEGAMKLMAARAAAKQELRAQVTTIQSRHNNPLKFSVDPQQALAQLLQPPMRGFMPGPEAVRDAMDDLLGHNIGTMAGTRAALQGMLKRFEPARLEAKLSNKGLVDSVLPMNRRAKLWELYVEHFEQVQDEAQDDFHELFGKAFVKAYEQQIERLEASRRKP